LAAAVFLFTAFLAFLATFLAGFFFAIAMGIPSYVVQVDGLCRPVTMLNGFRWHSSGIQDVLMPEIKISASAIGLNLIVIKMKTIPLSWSLPSFST
jgi:hypothetical protein